MRWAEPGRHAPEGDEVAHVRGRLAELPDCVGLLLMCKHFRMGRQLGSWRERHWAKAQRVRNEDALRYPAGVLSQPRDPTRAPLGRA